jgi:hypothetical protein
MKLALRILSYTLAGIILLGAFVMAADGDFDGYSLFAFMLILAQAVVAIAYTHQKK